MRKVLIPVCKALVDPSLDLLNSSRFVVGTGSDPSEGVIAFVIAKDQSKQVFSPNGFDQQLHQYTHLLTEPFDIDGHARAATLIHEFAHLYTPAHDISTAESRRPFSDLIEILTVTGRLARDSLQQIQREALSLATRVTSCSHAGTTSRACGRASTLRTPMTPSSKPSKSPRAVRLCKMRATRFWTAHHRTPALTRFCATPTPSPVLSVRWDAISTLYRRHLEPRRLDTPINENKCYMAGFNRCIA